MRRGRGTRGGDPRRAARRASLAPAAAVLLVALLPYAPLLDAGYVQDDHLAVEDNAIVARGSLAEIFSTSYWEGAKGNDRSLYRPIPIGSFALERKLAGEPSPRLSHAVNIALHACVSLAVLALARRLGLGRRGALVAALLFAVHPIHSEAVANVVGRSELLAALFAILALLAMGRSAPWSSGRDAPSERVAAPRARPAAWTAAALTFLALGSKETAVALLPLLVLQEILFRPGAEGPRRAAWIDRLAAFAPVTLAVGAFAALRIAALEAVFLFQRVPSADNPVVGLDGPRRLFTALAIAARYAWRTIFGFPLAADHSGAVLPVETSLLAPLPIAGLAFLAVLLVLALAPLRLPVARGASTWTARRASFAASLFLLPYLVVGNLLFPIGAGLAERLVYLPSAGIYLLAGLAVEEALGRISGRRALPGLAAVGIGLAALLGAMTWKRSIEWRSDRSIFEAALRTNPGSPRANYIIGTLDHREGRPILALSRIDRVLDLWPTYLAAWGEKAVLAGETGDLRSAEAAAREAIRLDPFYALAHFNLGVALHRMGRLPEAERSLRKAVLLDPRHATSWAELGHVRRERGDAHGASEAYRRAAALGRSDLRIRASEPGTAETTPRGSPPRTTGSVPPPR